MDFVKKLMDWYRQNARDLPWRRTGDAYAVWVSEIMLQQTRVTAVIPYYERFINALPNVMALSAADDDALNKLWEGLGYYSRVRNMKRAAQQVAERFGGQMPTRYADLITLPGVGAYTAGAVASIAGGEAAPAVDGNVLRVWMRLYNDPADIALPAVKQRVTDEIRAILPQKNAGTFNAAMMELGACVCVPNGAPHCADCPVSDACEAKRAGTMAMLPNKSAKRPRRVEEKTVFALCVGGRYAVYRRPAKGLLAGLWQLPDVSGLLTQMQMADQLTRWGARPKGEIAVYLRRHIFTHIEWHMRVYSAEAELTALPEGWRLSDETTALPTAYRVCLPENGDGGSAV